MTSSDAETEVIMVRRATEVRTKKRGPGARAEPPPARFEVAVTPPLDRRATIHSHVTEGQALSVSVASMCARHDRASGTKDDETRPFNGHRLALAPRDVELSVRPI